MERIGDDGERHEVDPGQVARYDQMEARYDDLARKIMFLRGQIREAALADDTAAMAACTKRMEALVQTEWKDAPVDLINFSMFLIHLLDQARAWTDRSFETIDIMIRQLGALARPGHPLRTLPGFAESTLEMELDIHLDTAQQLKGEQSETSFTTDTGIELFDVHAEQACVGQFCVIHNPAPGPWDNWDTHWREDWKLMVRICAHDVHHVAIEERLRMPFALAFDDEHPAGCDCPCDFSRCETIVDAEGKITGFRAK